MEHNKIMDNIGLLKELISCSDPLYFWMYDAERELLDTNCPEPLLDTLFASTGCKDYMLVSGQEHTAPLILSTQTGLMWAAAFEKADGKTAYTYVIGPVFARESSLSQFDRRWFPYDLPASMREKLMTVLHSLPIVFAVNFFQYAVMLHYCITGEKLTRSSLHYQNNMGETQESGNYLHHDRNGVYRTERALLEMVRTGNRDHANSIGRAASISTGVGIHVGDSLRHAKTSGTVFTSLCVRAAIEGGVSPETAYSRGDAYIDRIEGCHTISEVTSVNHAMYEDFIDLVHQRKHNGALSKHIQSCVDYIHIHAEEKISLEQLAARLSYSQYYLSRKFKEEVGCSINDYIKTVKCQRAKLLLSNTDLSIQEITTTLNFCTRTHFSKTFQQIEGVTPVQYRAENQHL